MQILPHCVWVDNYYKYFRTSYPKASTGLRKDCAWTVSARVSVPFHLNDNFVLDIIRREGMPAMPPDQFADDYVKELITAYSKFESIRVNELVYDTSLSKDIKRLPLKPEGNDPKLEQAFFPRGISQHNIASNEGLVSVLAELRNEYKDNMNYLVILADVNIHKRIMKVLSYDVYLLLFTF